MPYSFFNNAAGLRPATLLKKRLGKRRFSVNFVKFLRTTFFYITTPGAASEATSCKGSNITHGNLLH